MPACFLKPNWNSNVYRIICNRTSLPEIWFREVVGNLVNKGCLNIKSVNLYRLKCHLLRKVIGLLIWSIYKHSYIEWYCWTTSSTTNKRWIHRVDWVSSTNLGASLISIVRTGAVWLSSLFLWHLGLQETITWHQVSRDIVLHDEPITRVISTFQRPGEVHINISWTVRRRYHLTGRLLACFCTSLHIRH